MKTDTKIRRDVQNELQSDPSVDDSKIGVAVKDGVVTLVGEVSHLADRFAAEEIAKRVLGVRAVANDVEVKIPIRGERSDTEVATAAANALASNATVGTLRLQAVVKHGWINLSGQVSHDFQKAVADTAVRYLRGVKGLTNDIVVNRAGTLSGVP